MSGIIMLTSVLLPDLQQKQQQEGLFQTNPENLTSWYFWLSRCPPSKFLWKLPSSSLIEDLRWMNSAQPKIQTRQIFRIRLEKTILLLRIKLAADPEAAQKWALFPSEV
jgi:hypothetical protein